MNNNMFYIIQEYRIQECFIDSRSAGREALIHPWPESSISSIICTWRDREPGSQANYALDGPAHQTSFILC